METQSSGPFLATIYNHFCDHEGKRACLIPSTVVHYENAKQRMTAATPSVASTPTKVEVSAPQIPRYIWLYGKHACMTGQVSNMATFWSLLLRATATPTAPRTNELNLARASIDLPFLDLPQLFLAHRLHLVRLRYLLGNRMRTRKN